LFSDVLVSETDLQCKQLIHELGGFLDHSIAALAGGPSGKLDLFQFVADFLPVDIALTAPNKFLWVFLLFLHR